MKLWLVALLVLPIVVSACGPGQAQRAWACSEPEHGDYFMDELFATPEAALASVDDLSGYEPMDTEAGREYVKRDRDGAIERVVEVGSVDGRWGVIAVTSCTGFG